MHSFILLRAINMNIFKVVHICLYGLFVLFPLYSVCFGRSVPCLVCVVGRWMCPCFILLHVQVICILFGTIALSYLCTGGDGPCNLISLRPCCHICASLLFLL
jgi:hypothetical protein